MSVGFESNLERRTGLAVVLAILATELIAIGLIYKHLIEFSCRDNWPAGICHTGNGMMVGVYTMTGALVVFSWLLPGPVKQLIAKAAPRNAPLFVNLLGFAAMLAPVPLLQPGSGTSMLVPVLGLWAIGVVCGATGAVLMLAPLSHWKKFFAKHGAVFSFSVAAGLLAPVAAVQIRPYWWDFQGLAAVTFSSSAWIMRAFGYDLDVDPEKQVIGAGDFYISVAPVCSGIEGIALVSVFITIYLVLFRRELSFPAVLLLYPIGIFASFCLNIVRIVTLLAIGLNGQPELAVGGFHSHAGWLMFTVLSVTLVLAANSFAWVHSSASTGSSSATRVVRNTPHRLPFLKDPVVALILPFVIFMASALVAQTFSNVPGLLYPMRFLAMAACVLIFVPIYLRLPWKLDGISVLCGVVVGVVWLATADASDAATDLSVALAGMSSIAFFIWVFCRIAGTIVLVPLIEELFFRGYLTNAIEGSGGRWRVLLALVVTSALFGALHDRWIIAALAGVAFGLVRIRSGRITDAIVAHAVANAIIAAAAAMRSDWALI